MKSVRMVFLVFLCVGLVGVITLFGFLATGKRINLPGADRDLVKVLDESWTAAAYTSIELDTDPLDVYVTTSPTAEDIHISCYQYEDWDIDVKENDKSLFISAPERASFNSFFWFGVRKSPYFTVEIPENFDGSLKIRTSSGDIEIKGDFTAGEVKMKTSSGDMKLDQLTAELISLECSSGDIYFRDLIGTQVLMETSSGEIEGDWIDGEMRIKASSGDLRIKKLSGAGDLNTSSGEIDIGEYTRMQGDVFIESSSGDIDIRNFGILGGDLSLRSTSGEINVFFNEKPEASVNGETNSGDLYIFGAGYKRSVRLDDSSAEYQISVQTSSGDIDLKTR